MYTCQKCNSRRVDVIIRMRQDALGVLHQVPPEGDCTEVICLDCDHTTIPTKGN